MCGICGVYNYRDDEPADRRLVEAMTASMVHRGPDDSGVHCDRELGLGVRRLSIIDLAGGAQPMSNEDGTVRVVQNGEIYNFHDLRRELESYGHVFRTRSDTEAIVHAYEQWGVGGLARLNGMFAVAIWDSAARRLVLARDPFGVKPLYHWDGGGTLVFGSEVRPLLRHPRVERTVDLDAVRELLELTYVPSPRTAFAGISKLLPGHALVYGPGGGSLRRFHPVAPPHSQLPARELREQLREAIAAAVRRQRVADVPVGVMLSGGADSAAVAALLADREAEPVRTFTVGFGHDFAHDELEPARRTARRIGAEHHELVISAAEYDEFLPRSIWHLEEPIATASTLAFFKVCELAREHVKVVLTGQGADEPFAGYARHLGERYGPVYRRLPRAMRDRVVSPLVERLPRNEQLKRGVRSLGTEEPLERLGRVYSTLGDPLGRRLFGDELLATGNGHRSIARWQADVAERDGLSQMLYVDARTSLADNLLMYGDKMSMAVSLEARVPFLDLELMALAESIPPKLKVNGLKRKRILKDAISPWVPAEVRRRRKIGFTTPVDGWFRRELGTSLRERLLAPGSATRTYLRPQTVRAMIDEHGSGRHDHKRILFSLLTLELWHEQFIRSPASALGTGG
ncbi:asparagine synthase (glutamine-hydrolyzing) [soil metagenome]